LWEFGIGRAPDGEAASRLFDHLPEGASLMLDGPYGLAYLRADSPRDVVCIAGGSGLSPMLSIARGILGNAEMTARKVHFFYGGRTPDDICGRLELSLLPGFGERLFYECAVSDPVAPSAWEGKRGFVHSVVQAHLGARLASMECYVAGPPPMVQACQRMLVLEERVPQAQIHFDRFF
jgi:toluene monooxygenase electron transfer component